MFMQYYDEKDELRGIKHGVKSKMKMKSKLKWTVRTKERCEESKSNESIITDTADILQPCEWERQQLNRM